MSDLHPRPREECAFDAVALGEVMLRLDSSEGHIRTARTFRVWEGGREYNVARGLRRCFGLRTAIVTALADNEVGRLVEDLMLQGVRPRPLGDLAAAPRRRRLRPRLRRLGVRWFHTGGIFAALSESAAEVAEEAMAAARRHGTIVSYDLNYRPSLWQSIGGMARAREVNRRLVFQVDMLLGNEEDFTASSATRCPAPTCTPARWKPEAFAR